MTRHHHNRLMLVHTLYIDLTRQTRGRSNGANNGLWKFTCVIFLSYSTMVPNWWKRFDILWGKTFYLCCICVIIHAIHTNNNLTRSTLSVGLWIVLNFKCMRKLRKHIFHRRCIEAALQKYVNHVETISYMFC